MVDDKTSAAAVAPLSSLAMAMLFGTVMFATVALATRTWLIGDSRAIQAAMSPRSQPLDTTSFTSIYTLLHHCTVFGIILFFAYICEHHPFFSHDEKTYDRDQFFFLVALVILLSFYTIHRNDAEKKNENSTSSDGAGAGSSSSSATLGDKLQALSDGSTNSPSSAMPRETDEVSYQSYGMGTVQTTGTYIPAKETDPRNDLLNRDQTEEWKGWMQFIFLIYHYYHAEEVYNSIRVMITCYVWMTGFGNFSFFYLKNDFSFVRVVQMLWRLNFLCIFLCLTQGTTYILYYICPLHTYFFLMVYATMAIGKNLNYTKYGLRIKLAVVACFIFLMWDVDSKLFQMVHFPFVGNTPILGATKGSMWEWYFRTTLDHWSTFLGMIFAANYPITSLFYRKLEALPPLKCWLGKLAVGIPLLVAFVMWAKGPFMLEKLQYNITNPYFGFLPLITYIYFRNLTPTLRSHSMNLLHEIGKTTLETYLMQHHIWLTSNAKTVLILIPGWPKVNLLVVTFIYFMLSRKLYRLTLFLRGMLLPNDMRKCIRSLTVMTFAILLFYAMAMYMRMFGYASLSTVAIVTIVCGYLLYQTVVDSTWQSYAISDSSDELSNAESIFSSNNFEGSQLARSFPPVIGLMVILIFGISWRGMAIAGAGKIKTLHPGCGALVNHGKWIPVDGCNEAARGAAYRNDGVVNFATCSPAGSGYTWGWETTPSSTHCRFTQRSEKDLKKWLHHRRIAFIGDSMIRNLYHAVCRQVGISDAGQYDAGGPKHINIYRKAGDVTLDFKWAAFATDQLAEVKDLNVLGEKEDYANYDMVVVGGGAWDRLHVYGTAEEISSHGTTIEELKDEILTMKLKGSPVVWITPTTMNDSALNTAEKRERITEFAMGDMRKVYEKRGVLSAASFIIDGPSFSKHRVKESFDGVHYPQDVYDAGAQILANSFDWLLPERRMEEPFEVPHTGEMARPFLGLMMLCLCFIGLFFFDGFFGFSYLACLCIKGILPSDLYLEAFTMLHEKSNLPPLNLSSGLSIATTFTRSTAKTKNTMTLQMTGKERGRKRAKKPSSRGKMVGLDEEIEALLGGND